jgi:ATPase subunit of ABC transporter with duplicated ATPase domains
MTAHLLEVSDATITTPGGRVLFDGLNLRLARDHVALVGRNGVGKSTLLAVLAGQGDLERGRVRALARVHHVPQRLPRDTTQPLSDGERRRCALAEARASGADILLLDEPTEDLDDEAVSWLREWLRTWPGGLVVASHDRRLLSGLRTFFIVSETGCRAFVGALPQLDVELLRHERAAQARYVHGLNRLTSFEEHMLHVTRRRARKKRYGRCSELDRATPRIVLNKKRSEAQAYQGKFAKMREERLTAMRDWSQATRRALAVDLGLELPIPTLPASSGRSDVAVLRGVSARAGDRVLFEALDLELGRQRVALAGPNGAGKTTLLDIVLGRRAPSVGVASRDLTRIGAIAQGGTDWMLDESLLSLLRVEATPEATEEVAKTLVSHEFPLALASRPLRLLSAGERTRAALIALFRRCPTPELLVFDEPTYSLDLLGQRAVTEALRLWPGGLLVASHDRAFLSEIGIERTLRLGQ